MVASVVCILCILHSSNSRTQYLVFATDLAGTALCRTRSISSSVCGCTEWTEWVGVVLRPKYKLQCGCCTRVSAVFQLRGGAHSSC